MDIHDVDGPNKRVTFQFTEQEWGVLLWIQQNRSIAWFTGWLAGQFAVMAQRKETQLDQDMKTAWRQADQATKDQIKTLLGV